MSHNSPSEYTNSTQISTLLDESQDQQLAIRRPSSISSTVNHKLEALHFSPITPEGITSGETIEDTRFTECTLTYLPVPQYQMSLEYTGPEIDIERKFFPVIGWLDDAIKHIRLHKSFMQISLDSTCEPTFFGRDQLYVKAVFPIVVHSGILTNEIQSSFWKVLNSSLQSVISYRLAREAHQYDLSDVKVSFQIRQNYSRPSSPFISSQSSSLIDLMNAFVKEEFELAPADVSITTHGVLEHFRTVWEKTRASTHGDTHPISQTATLTNQLKYHITHYQFDKSNTVITTKQRLHGVTGCTGEIEISKKECYVGIRYKKPPQCKIANTETEKNIIRNESKIAWLHYAQEFSQANERKHLAMLTSPKQKTLENKIVKAKKRHTDDHKSKHSIKKSRSQ